MLKITPILCQKSQKGLDNNSQFELKIVQFYVFQGKKQTKITVIKGPKSQQKTRYHGGKVAKCFKKPLKNALKFEKVAENNARFE